MKVIKDHDQSREQMFSSNSVVFRKLFLVGNLPRCSSSVALKYSLYGQALEGDPVIFLHGVLGSRHNFKFVGKNTSKILSRPVIVADARNHGQSPHAPSHTYLDMASDVSDLLKTLAFSRASLVGHSMGGRTAMTLALTQPEKVKNLVVVDISPISRGGPTPEFIFVSDLLDQMSQIKFGEGTNLRQAQHLVDERLAEAESALRSFVKTNLIEKGGRAFWRINIDVVKEYYTSDICRFPDELIHKKYNGPTLFVGGEMSNFLPPEHEPDIKEIFPNCSVKYINNAGHNVHADEPEKFLEILNDFLQKHS